MIEPHRGHRKRVEFVRDVVRTARLTGLRKRRANWTFICGNPLSSTRYERARLISRSIGWRKLEILQRARGKTRSLSVRDEIENDSKFPPGISPVSTFLAIFILIEYKGIANRSKPVIFVFSRGSESLGRYGRNSIP